MVPVTKESSMQLRSQENLFPRLGVASCEKVEISKEYQSGATYSGQIQGNKKTGKGIFSWPNGAKYDGEFRDNVRHGRGTQIWPDGSRFEGMFVEDMRQGQGHHNWANGESYEGIFYKDRRHGTGKYCWADDSSYSGTFFMDQKEGYGTFNFSDGRKFQGLYKQDEREGPGVMTYPDGRQDVGLWHRGHLVKLCTALDDAFTMKNHPEFDYFPEEHRIFIKPDSIANKLDIIEEIVNPKEEFNYDPRSNISSRASEVFQDGLHTESLATDVQSYSEEFKKSQSSMETHEHAENSLTTARSGSSDNSQISSVATVTAKGSSESISASQLDLNVSGSPKGRVSRPNSTASTSWVQSAKSKRSRSAKSSAGSSRARSAKSSRSRASTILEHEPEDSGIVAWNNTRSSIEMQKHIIKHSINQSRAGFSVENVLNGSREGFAEKGPCEVAAEEFIKAATEGRAKEVANLVHDGKVSVDVADKSGHTALLAAAVNWHHNVINCLLDNGADINKLNDEGVSALAACHVFFYPVDQFHFNIAERYLEKPAEFSGEPSYDVNQAVKSILSSKKKPHPPAEKRHSTVDSKKISRLREMYSAGPKNDLVESDKENDQAEVASGKHSHHSETNDRKLGTLKVKRSVRINVEEMLAPGPEPPVEPSRPYRKRRQQFDDDFDSMSDVTTEVDEFESAESNRNFGIEVSDQLIERCATVLSTNEMVVSRERSAAHDPQMMGTVRRLAIDKSHHQLMESTIRLLLRRGADPNAASVPMPVLFFAIKAADVEAVKILLTKGASTSATLSEKKGGLAPLHIAVAIPGEEGVEITALILNALADPDIRATEDDSFLNRNLQEEWSKDPIDAASEEILGGRTPLHIACARDDHYKNACSVVHLLLDHHANPNLLCNGHSPLALAVRSGNDLAVDQLLAYHADPCLPLTHGVGSALCIASSTEYEHKRTPEGRIQLVDKLIAAGADILAPIPIGPKRIMGTAVDYAYYLYNLDRRIAHMPYHALTPAERETFNARRRLLGHIGDIMRVKAIQKEKQKLENELREGRRSRSPSPNFVYTGAGAPLTSGRSKHGKGVDSKVSFGVDPDGEVRKPAIRYCYECGRSVGVRLSACTRCKEVYYCSKACKLKAWNARHKEECVRVGGHSPGGSKRDKRIDSPTPATDPDRGKPKTVLGINAGDPRIKGMGDSSYHVSSEQNNEKGNDNSNESYLKSIKQNLMHDTLVSNVPGQVHSKSVGSFGKMQGQTNKKEPKKGDFNRGHKISRQGQIGVRGQNKTKGQREGTLPGHDTWATTYNIPKELLRYITPMSIGSHGNQTSLKGGQVPFKGRSISAGNPGKLAMKGPLTIQLENGKIIYVDNYSYV